MQSRCQKGSIFIWGIGKNLLPNLRGTVQFLTESLFSATFSFWWLSVFCDLWPHHSSLCLDSHSDSPLFYVSSFVHLRLPSAFFFFLKEFFFFNVDHFLKVCIGFVTLFLFYVFCFWPWGIRNFSSPMKDQNYTFCIGRWRLNHLTAREVNAFFFKRLLLLDLGLTQESRMISTSPFYYILNCPFPVFFFTVQSGSYCFPFF